MNHQDHEWNSYNRINTSSWRLNKESFEVSYVNTDSVRVASAMELEVLENSDVLLCGSLGRIENAWGNGKESDSRMGWSTECYMAASVGEGKSVFFQPMMGVTSPAIEVYIAGCCGGVPVILTKTILVSPRRRGSRHFTLGAMPEDEELDKEESVAGSPTQSSEPEGEDDEPDGKIGGRFCTEDMHYGEDGQLSWFNAGVRVGVGIGLGIGIGVGLLMRSQKETTRNFRRRFL